MRTPENFSSQTLQHSSIDIAACTFYMCVAHYILSYMSETYLSNRKETENPFEKKNSNSILMWWIFDIGYCILYTHFLTCEYRL